MIATHSDSGASENAPSPVGMQQGVEVVSEVASSFEVGSHSLGSPDLGSPDLESSSLG